MKAAVLRVRSGQASAGRAAAGVVPLSTLRSWVKNPTSLDNPPKVGRPTILDPRDEQTLAWYLLECEASFAGLTQDVAGELAKKIVTERNKLRKAMGIQEVFFTTKTGVPSREWWRGFFRRHPELAMRKPSRHSAAQINAGKPAALRAYIARVKARLKDILPVNFINVDELDLHQTEVKKRVIGRRGARTANAYKPSNYSDHVTLVSAIRGDGTALPPYFIFKGKTPVSNELAEGVDCAGVGLGTTGNC